MRHIVQDQDGRGLEFEPNAEIGQEGVFFKGLTKEGLCFVKSRFLCVFVVLFPVM